MHSHLWNAKQIKSNASRLDSVILLIMAIRSQWGIANILLPNLMKLQFSIWISGIFAYASSTRLTVMKLFDRPYSTYGMCPVYARNPNSCSAHRSKVYIRLQPPYTGQLGWLSVWAKAVQLKVYGGVVRVNLCRFTGFYPKGQISPCLIELQM